MKPHEHTDSIIARALQGALDNRPGMGARGSVHVDKNLVDALTSRLEDAGVDMDAVNDAFADADPSRIDFEDPRKAYHNRHDPQHVAACHECLTLVRAGFAG